MCSCCVCVCGRVGACGAWPGVAGVRMLCVYMCEKGGPWRAPPLWCAGGGVLLSHTLAGAVPSALAVLASGFGKGKSGRVPAAVAAATLAGPDHAPARGAGVGFGYRIADACRFDPPPSPAGQGGWLCWVGRPISAGRLHSLAGRPRPVYQPRRLRGAFPPRGWRRTRLEAGFPLRCFQRLSLPNVANQPCSWRNNWHTRGSSVPVLSYWGQPFSILLRAQRIGTELSHDVLNPARVPL